MHFIRFVCCVVVSLGLLLALTIARSAQPDTVHQRTCDIPPNSPNDGPRAMEMYAYWIAQLTFRPEEAEAHVNAWNTPTCLLDDGRQRLAAVRSGFARRFSEGFSPDYDSNRNLHAINILRKNRPKSAFLALAEAEYWVQSAWAARGDGYADSVAPDGWKIFRERLAKAEEGLREAKSYSDHLPNWYEQMLQVQSLLGRPAIERERLFMEGIKKYNTYLPLYFVRVRHLSPKWGGTWDEVDRFVNWSIHNTRATHGETMYARLYWLVISELPEGTKPFAGSHVQWQKMKKGFGDLMQRFPNSKWNLNNFAKFACLSGDKSAFLALRKQIGENVIQDAWPKSTSLDLCEHKMGYAR